MPARLPTRLPLGRTPRRLSFERRFKLWLAFLALPTLLLAALLAETLHATALTLITILAALTLAWLLLASLFFEQTIRPLQTLSNVVAALREDDFSFRARGARRGDALGDLAFEINTLAATIERQRIAAMDALTLVQRVLASMQSPVLAFDDAARLRLHNAAATAAFALPAQPLGLTATQLALADLLTLPDQAAYPAQNPGRFSIRRATFRLHGLPHTLLVLTDVAAALREEERLAFQRLIRVLSHEINNSLTPIQSIAGSLQTRLSKPTETTPQHLQRGLAIIEERASALNRFLQAYQRLARLPAPTLRPVALTPFLTQIAQLETRVPITLVEGPELTLSCDPDQLTQALINLLANAAEAALANPAVTPQVTLTWQTTSAAVTIALTDNGLGLASTANLFVPFYTTKPNGSGIGLALVQQIATAHAGTIALTPNPAGPGCTATLTLPRYHQPAGAHA